MANHERNQTERLLRHVLGGLMFAFGHVDQDQVERNVECFQDKHDSLSGDGVDGPVEFQDHCVILEKDGDRESELIGPIYKPLRELESFAGDTP